MGIKNNTNKWNSDIWNYAYIFLMKSSELLIDLPYITKGELNCINPSGRFQNPSFRHLQNLVHQAQYSYSKKDEAQFLSDSIDLVEYLDFIGIESDTLHLHISNIEHLFEITEPEIIYNARKIIEPQRSIIVCQNNIIELIYKNPTWLQTMTNYEFEELVSEIFIKYGFNVDFVTETNGKNKRIIAIKNDMDIRIKYLIECKRYMQDSKVSLDIVQRLYDVCYQKNANKGIVVTTSSFTKDAYKFASQHPWELDLKDYNSLLNWIKNIPKNRI